MKTHKRPPPEDIQRVIKEARADSHKRAAERRRKVENVIERSDKVQNKLRRAAAI